jgi:hypothetical protein
VVQCTSRPITSRNVEEHITNLVTEIWLRPVTVLVSALGLPRSARRTFWSRLPGGLPARRMRVFDQWRRNRGQVGFRRSGQRGAKYRVKYPSAQPPSPCHHGTASSTDPGVALNRGPRVRLSRFREPGRHRFDPLRRPMCGGMRYKGRHSPFFGFSALRSASRAPIPPAASAVTLQHSTALSIQRVLNPPGGAASP